MCCNDMENNIYHIDQKDNFDKNDQNDQAVYFSSKFNEYGIPIHDGENGRATSYILIQYCPWCGKKLPDSMREEWFERLESLGFESPFEDFDKIPSEYKSSEWYA